MNLSWESNFLPTPPLLIVQVVGLSPWTQPYYTYSLIILRLYQQRLLLWAFHDNITVNPVYIRIRKYFATSDAPPHFCCFFYFYDVSTLLLPRWWTPTPTKDTTNLAFQTFCTVYDGTASLSCQQCPDNCV